MLVTRVLWGMTGLSSWINARARASLVYLKQNTVFYLYFFQNITSYMSLASTCFTYIVHEIDFRLMKTGQKCHVAVSFVFSNFCDCFYAVHHEFQVQYIKRRPLLFSLYRISVTAASLLFSSITLWNRDISLARMLTLWGSFTVKLEAGGARLRQSCSLTRR